MLVEGNKEMNGMTKEQAIIDYEYFITTQSEMGYSSDEYTEREFKLIWLSDNLFDITTYDDDISLTFGKELFEVIKVIIDRTWNKYIKDESNYIKFIRCANLLDKGNYIEWGTSIRSCWFNDVEFFKWLVNEFIGEGK